MEQREQTQIQRGLHTDRHGETHGALEPACPAFRKAGCVACVHRHKLGKAEPFSSLFAALLAAWRFGRGFIEQTKLKLDGTVSIMTNDKVVVALTIRAVNRGRRHVRIKRVAVLLTKPLLSGGLPAGKARDVLERSSCQLKPSEMCLLTGCEGSPVELNPGGGEKSWRVAFLENIPFFEERKGRWRFAKAYVVLTTGQKIDFNFRLPEIVGWPPPALQRIDLQT